MPPIPVHFTPGQLKKLVLKAPLFRCLSALVEQLLSWNGALHQAAACLPLGVLVPNLLCSLEVAWVAQFCAYLLIVQVRLKGIELHSKIWL